VADLYRREFLALAAPGALFARSAATPLKRLVISVNAMFDRAAHSPQGLTTHEISLFHDYQAIAAYEYMTSGIFFDLSFTEGAYLQERGYSEIPEQFLKPRSINLFVTGSLGYDIDRDRTGGSSMGPRPRTRVLPPSPYFKTFLGLKDAKATTLPHEYAHHFTLDTQHSASMSGNLWADIRNDYWLWRQRHFVPIPEFRACANSEWARIDPA
jgi:hypothetical protein